LKFLGIDSWPPNSHKLPIWSTLRPIEKNIHAFFEPGPMKDVYLDFRLPWPAKIAARMLTPGKWWPFEIYLTTDHTYLGFPSIKNKKSTRALTGM
jgi:hypothetical protein